MSREPWYESENPSTLVRGASWRVGLWVIAVIVVCAVLSGIGWGISVAISNLQGQGNAIKIKNSAVNRIEAQQQFQTDYNDILAADQRISVFAAALKTNSKDQVAQTNYEGAVTICQQNVADYNALAAQFLSKDFRPAGLPEQIDSTNPATDCKEN